MNTRNPPPEPVELATLISLICTHLQPVQAGTAIQHAPRLEW